MRIKLFLSLLVAGSIAASAQYQGYKDGIEYFKAGQYDNAKTILEKTISDSQTDKSLANHYLGQVALIKGDKAAAKEYFDKGKAADVNNPYNYVGLGAIDLLNNNASAAADNFKKAQDLGKKNADVSVAVARAYYNADPVKYAKEIDKAMLKARKDSKNHEPAIYILEGDMLIDQQNYGEAAGRYESAITFEPNNPEGYVKYANAYFYVNQDFAIKKLEEYLQNHPESAMVQRELAEKNFQANRWRAASDLYGKYIQNPNHFPEDKARYAVLLYWGEKYDQSLGIANEILASDPSNFTMQRVRFLDYNAKGDYPKAVEFAEAFFNGNPNAKFNANDYTTYAEALSGIGNDSLAVVQYETAVEKYPEAIDLLKELSNAYSRKKDYARSADAYAAYLEKQENPSLSDIFGMSGRYLNAAATTAPEDTIRRRELAETGAKYVKDVLSRAEASPMMYQRLARLYVAGNGNKPDANAIEAYDKMVELLDADPKSADPTNAEAINMYWEAYAFGQAYASTTHNKEKFDEVSEKLKKYTELKNGLSK